MQTPSTPPDFDHANATWQMTQLLSEQLLYAMARIEALNQQLIVLLALHGVSSEVSAEEVDRLCRKALEQLRTETRPQLDRIRSDNSGSSFSQ